MNIQINEQREKTIYHILKALGINNLEKETLTKLRSVVHRHNGAMRIKGKKQIYTSGYRKAISDSNACGCSMHKSKYSHEELQIQLNKVL